MTTLDQTLGLGAQIADVERIRRLLGGDRLILIGHSWGGTFLKRSGKGQLLSHSGVMVYKAVVYFT